MISMRQEHITGNGAIPENKTVASYAIQKSSPHLEWTVLAFERTHYSFPIQEAKLKGRGPNETLML